MTDKSEAQQKDIRRGKANESDIYRFFGRVNGEKLVRRLTNKKQNAAKRGLEFSLTLDDLLAFGTKLLGKGVCDYSGFTFSTVSGDIMYPSIERIDDNKGYIRGNIAIVAVRANMLKDYFFHQKCDMNITITQRDKDMMQGIYQFMSDKKLQKKVADQYTCRTPEKEIKTEEPKQQTPIKEEKEVAIEPKITTETQESVKAPESSVVELSASSQAVSQELPEDVTVARGYAGLATSMSKIGMAFTLTFAQFKAAYTQKRCPFTGNELTGVRFAVILDRSKPISVGNICFTSESVAEAVNNLLTATGGTLGDLAKNLKRLGA